MTVTRIVVFALASWWLASGCSRPSETKCKEACWHQAKLVFWERAAQELAKAPQADRPRLEAEHQVAWDALVADTENPQPKVCIEACTKQGSEDDVNCILRATTAAASKACTN